ncbi:hypothetical protein [Changpingibacter yushuensis]|uniref:hypothetical protein n=1 Tax=Changpingibacter yushuensis TaxID=2758440 RepID=UPI001CB6D21E|nr:hypothetical protein [Changpingibacter yushuensis]
MAPTRIRAQPTAAAGADANSPTAKDAPMYWEKPDPNNNAGATRDFIENSEFKA